MKMINQVRYRSFRYVVVCLILLLGATNSPCKVIERQVKLSDSLQQLSAHVIINDDVEKCLSRRLAKIEDENKGKVIVDRRYNSVPKFINVGNEFYQLYTIKGEVEYADGTVDSATMEHSGMLQVGDLDLSSMYDRVYDSDEKVIDYYTVYPNPTVPNSEYRKVRKSEIILNRYIDYEALHNFDIDDPESLDIFVEISPNWGDGHEFCNSFSMTNLMNDLRNWIIDNGGDPENFSSVLFRYAPVYTLYLDHFKYKDWNEYSFVFPQINAVFSGLWYVEGGLGENCNLFVKMDNPTPPELKTRLIRNQDKRGYMDSWSLDIVLSSYTASQKYSYEYHMDIFLPYPTAPEDIEAARKAGYSIP